MAGRSPGVSQSNLKGIGEDSRKKKIKDDLKDVTDEPGG